MALRILVLEDRPEDAELVIHHLERAGVDVQWKRVDCEQDFVAALSPDIDIILADYNLPQFTGLRALQLLKATNLDIPLIVVTGTIGEEKAVECMRQGAADYLLKDRLVRLPMAVTSVLEGQQARRARARSEQDLRKSEERYRAVSDLTSDFCYSCRLRSDGKQDHEWTSGALEQITGYSAQEFSEIGGLKGIAHPDDRAIVDRSNQTVMAGREDVCELRIVTKAGDVRWLQAYALPDWDNEQQRVAGFVGAGKDITERKIADDRIQRQMQRLSALRVIGLAIRSSFDLNVTLRTVLDQIVTQLHVDAADILLAKAGGQWLELAAAQGFRQAPPRQVQIALGRGLPGRAVQERDIIAVHDLRVTQPGVPLWPTTDEFVSYHAVPLFAKGNIKGVLELFHLSPFVPDEEWTTLLQTLAGDAAIAIESATLFEDLDRTNAQLIQAYDSTIEGWSRAMDLRDRETEGHSQRVTDLTLQIADMEMLPASELSHIRRGALLHDIGKMGVPDAILRKPGPLSDEEWVVMKRHPLLAYDLLSPIEFLRPALDIPYCHHEKWDGTGYPRGLAGEAIPLAARIFAVADVWDALRSDRPYRAAWSKDKALDYIRQQSGLQFDPRVISAFLRLMQQS